MDLYSDKYYVERVQAGDVDCFACLLDRYSKQVYTLIYRVVPHREDAEELTQDVFMKVFKNIASFKGSSNFSTWIYRIAYNTAISETRKKKMELLAIEESLIDNYPEEAVSDMDHASSGQAERLENALEMLFPDERMIIMLFYMQEKSVEEISVITGLTVSNVKTKLHRTRKKLFILLKKAEEKER